MDFGTVAKQFKTDPAGDTAPARPYLILPAPLSRIIQLVLMSPDILIWIELKGFQKKLIENHNYN